MKKDWREFLPPDTIHVHEENLIEYYATMWERQEIWWKRNLVGWKQPWTHDSIFQNYRFCNVYRELDRSSQYLIKNVYLKHNDLTRIIFCILAHRIYNKPETFEEIGYPVIHEWNDSYLKNWLGKLEKLEKKGFKVLNQEAYKINTYMWGGEPRWQAYTVHILAEFAKIINKLVRTIKEGTALQVVNLLRTVKGCGMFLTHEYYQDFCDLNTYVLQGFTKFDKNSWTNAGPGAKGGLRLIFPSLPEEHADQGLKWLLELADEYLAKVNPPNTFKYLNWDPVNQKYFVSSKGTTSLSIHEFWCCEFLKYKKMQWGLGKQRSKFVSKN